MPSSFAFFKALLKKTCLNLWFFQGLAINSLYSLPILKNL